LQSVETPATDGQKPTRVRERKRKRPTMDEATELSKALKQNNEDPTKGEQTPSSRRSEAKASKTKELAVNRDVVPLWAKKSSPYGLGSGLAIVPGFSAT
jgi:hypothetical protein